MASFIAKRPVAAAWDTVNGAYRQQSNGHSLYVLEYDTTYI
ncbi:hypothetical protein [Spirosoma endophyticum]|nr:hypothetical protein [Spirosoma endophyticum]